MSEVKKPYVPPPPKPKPSDSTFTTPTSAVPPVTPFKEDIITLDLKGNVGFDCLPQQYVRSTLANGYYFNILCVGETGIGKTTLMESLFDMELGFKSCDSEMQTVELIEREHEFDENISVHLKVIETAGFGDQVDKESSISVIVDYIDRQYEKYLEIEMDERRNPSGVIDRRIHACIYFISPTGNGLKAIDILAMRELSKRVNVIPIIAKADTIETKALARYKAKISEELLRKSINTYTFPVDDETVRDQNTRLNKLLPFAVVASENFVDTPAGRKRARQYVWGTVEIENEQHSDFAALREALLRINVEDLRHRTHTVLYEQYRCEKFQRMGINESTGSKTYETLSNKRRSQREEFERRHKQLKEDFVKKVMAKEAELKRQEEEMLKSHEERMRKIQNDLDAVDKEIHRLTEEELFIKERLDTVNAKKKK